MTESEKELNLKIARWVWPDATHITWSTRGQIVARWVVEGQRIGEAIPSKPFTESLDAQAKYLWPKLACYVFYPRGDKHIAVMDLDGNHIQIAIAETPALASAQAIAKLLEGKA